jgi:hypothetical protein
MLVDPPVEDARLVTCIGLWLTFTMVAFIRRRFLSPEISKDQMSEIDVSETDRDLFWALSNPDVVSRDARRSVPDDHKGPSPTAQSAVFADARRREGQQARHEGAVPAGPQSHVPAYDVQPSPADSAFQARVDAKVRERNDDNELRRSPMSSHGEKYPANGPSTRSEGSRGSRGSPGTQRSHDTHKSRDSRRSHKSEGSRHSHDRDDRDDNQTPLRGEALRLEKQAALLDLERLRINGVVLSRGYDMSDRLEDMRFEIQKHDAALDEKQMVGWMKSCMRVGLTGVEVGNKKFGPFLALDGWSSEITTDMNKFDMPMARLYRKYGRRSTMSPEMELAWVIFGSMGMYHCRQKGGAMLAAMSPPSQPETTEFGTFSAESHHESMPPSGKVPAADTTPQRKMSAPDF